MRRLPIVYFECNYNPLNLGIGLLVSKESDSVLFRVFWPKGIFVAFCHIELQFVAWYCKITCSTFEYCSTVETNMTHLFYTDR